MPSKRIPRSCVQARINALLLKTHLLIAIATSASQIDSAMAEVDRAMYLVERFRMLGSGYHARVLLFRGHCFRALACWDDAAREYKAAWRAGDMALRHLSERCLLNMQCERDQAIDIQIARGITDDKRPSDDGARKLSVKIDVMVRQGDTWVNENDSGEETERGEDSFMLQMVRNVKDEQERERRDRARLAAETQRKADEKKRRADVARRQREAAEMESERRHREEVRLGKVPEGKTLGTAAIPTKVVPSPTSGAKDSTPILSQPQAQTQWAKDDLEKATAEAFEKARVFGRTSSGASVTTGSMSLERDTDSPILGTQMMDALVTRVD